MAASGSRSSWLTRPRNSVRSRSISSNGARSCMVMTTDRRAPPSTRTGVMFSSVRMLRPSGTVRTTSSARIDSLVPSNSVSRSSLSDTSRPSAPMNVITSRSCSAGRPAVRRLSTIRLASRLIDFSRPLFASKTTTPTGEVSTRAARSARACRSARCAREFTTAAAACEANSTSTSSSSSVNSSPPAFSERKKLPTLTPR